MKKRLCLVLLSALTLISSCLPVLAAGGERVKFGEVETAVNGDKVAVSVPVYYTGEGSITQNLYIAAGYVDKNDAILEIIGKEETVSLSAGEGTSETVITVGELTYRSPEAAELKCFFWDGLSNRTPLDNIAPIAVGEVNEIETTVNSTSFEWDAAVDDYSDVASYNVYNKGKLVGNTRELNFTEEYLARKSKNEYLVKPVDADGAEAAEGIKFNVNTKDVPNVTFLPNGEISDGNQGGIQLCLRNQGTYEYTEAGMDEDGVPYRRMTAFDRGDAVIYSRLALKFSAEYAATLNPLDDYTMEVVYFDEEVEPGTTVYLNVEYSISNPNSYDAPKKVWEFKGTNQWQTACFDISGAHFNELATNPGAGYALLRLFTTYITPEGKEKSKDNLKIHSVAIIPKKDNILPEARFWNDKATLTANMEIPSMDGLSIQENAGTNCMYVPLGNMFTINVVPNFLSAGKVCAEITYFIPENSNESKLNLFYNSASGFKALQQDITAKGKWQTMTFDITDVRTNSATGVPFAVGTENSDLYVSNIRVFNKAQ